MRLVEVTRPNVYDIASRVRKFLSQEWPKWRETRGIATPPVVSASMCRMTSAFLSQILEEELGGKWTVMGGSPDSEADFGDVSSSEGGMINSDGIWHGHYWVVSGGVLVDITADQFGFEPIIVSTPSDSRYKANYYRKAITGHLKHVNRTLASWVETWHAATK